MAVDEPATLAAAPGDFDLFISYARRDARKELEGRPFNVVKTLKFALERHRIGTGRERRRFRVCTDIDDFALEGDFESLMRDRIQRSGAFLLVSSPSAGASPYVVREIAIAAEQRGRLRLLAGVLGAQPHDTAPDLFALGTVAADLDRPPGASRAEWRAHLVGESHKVVAAATGLEPWEVHNRFRADLRRIWRRIGLAGALGLCAAAALTIMLAGEAGYHRVRTLPLAREIVAPAGVGWTADQKPVLVDENVAIVWTGSGLPVERRLPVRALYVEPAGPGVLLAAGVSDFVVIDLARAAAPARHVSQQIEGVGATVGKMAVALDNGDLLFVDGNRLSAAPRPISQRGRRFPVFRETGPLPYGSTLALRDDWLASVDDQGHLAVLNRSNGRFVMPAKPQFPLAKPVERIRDPVLYETENTRPIGALAFSPSGLIFGDGEGLKRVSLPGGQVSVIRHCALELPRHITVLDNGERLVVFTNSTLNLLEREGDNPDAYHCRQTVSLAPNSGPRVALAPDGRTLLVAYFDGAPELWRLTFRVFGLDIPLY